MVEFGVLLPHFGQLARADLLLRAGQEAERLGFDSVWVRDHVLYEPAAHVDGGGDSRFFDGLTTLAVVGAATSKIALGTGSLIPVRHPLLLARIASTMSSLVGDRMILGLGAGASDEEFETLGLNSTAPERVEWIKETIAILRQAGENGQVACSGRHFAVADARIEPVPHAPPRIWYCGTAPASVRLAGSLCDGWLPGRIPLETFRGRLRKLREQAETAQRFTPTAGCRPLVVVHPRPGIRVDPELVRRLSAYANGVRFWERPGGAAFEAASDLEGILLAGDVGELSEQVGKVLDAGCDHLIFDFRASPETYMEALEAVGSEVLPRVRAA